MKSASFTALTAALLAFALMTVPGRGAKDDTSARTALLRAVDLNVNETQEVQLANGAKAQIKLLRLDETRDAFRNAVRQARVTVELNGQSLVLTSATYNLPVTFAGVQIDCPITKGYVGNSSQGNAWGLVKDARLRLWPADSPWIEPGTFVYPLKQRWFASNTQMANEPTFVDGGEAPGATNIYYHYGLDFGGAEGLVEVVAATNGRVISSGKEILPGYADSPAKPRYDVVYLLDDRGWYYRYSHLFSIDPAMRPGAPVAMGQMIGVLGKEGGSGGWSHLHFDITSRQPSGLWGIQEGYAFVWDAYRRQHAPKIAAVARPHHFVATGQKVLLDASKSWSASGRIATYDWTFTDGTAANGSNVERTYSRPGFYSEILKITDTRGEMDYDFASVEVIDPETPGQLPPSIHAVYAPTFGIRPGDPVTFKVRTFKTAFGHETWDFGDGTEKVTVKSDGNVNSLAKDGYAVTEHRFAQPGHYLVSVERANEHGHRAVARLHVIVEDNRDGEPDSQAGRYSSGQPRDQAGREKKGQSLNKEADGAFRGGQTLPAAEVDSAKDEIWTRIALFFRPPAEFSNDYGHYLSPLRFYDGRAVSSKEQWSERRREILAKWTELMGPWPPVLEKPRIEFLEEEKRENFVQHRVRLEIAPDQIEVAYLLVPDGAGPFPAVVVPYYEPLSSLGRKEPLRDFGYQLAKRGFVSLSLGSPGGSAREPVTAGAVCQPLSFLAYVAANAWNALANHPKVNRARIGIVGHSYGGKWAMFAACLYEKFACGVWSDPGIVFDETRPNVNYWEPWYLGLDSTLKRKPGVPKPENPRTGAYKKMMEAGLDLHEFQALMAPRPFLVSGGAEDRPARWRAMNHVFAVNTLLGQTNRVAMTNREGHTPTPESNEQIYLFFEHFLKGRM